MLFQWTDNKHLHHDEDDDDNQNADGDHHDDPNNDLLFIEDDDVMMITMMIIMIIMMNDLNDPTHFFILTIQSNPSPQTEIQTFSCPTSSIPTIEIHSVIRWFTMFNSYQTIPTLVVFALPSTMPHTIMSVQCRTQCSDIIISTRFKFLWQNFTILTEKKNFHNIDGIS